MVLKEIVNVMPDDKFLDYYITMSEKYLPNKSSYIVFSNSEELVYIKNKHVNLFILEDSTENFESIISDLRNTSVVIFHSFQENWYPFIESISLNVHKVWLFWGFEGYSALPQAKFSSISSKYAKYENTILGKIRFLYNFGKDFLVDKSQKKTREIIKRMDYCATWVDADHLIARKINPRIKSIKFNYYTKELMGFEAFSSQRLNRDKLILGNSANPSNNHIDALHFLYDLGYSGIIFCPLSYGGSKVYKGNVCLIGNKLFGENFKPLLKFMPLDEYQHILNECGIIWMNHLRQQAAGNLLFSFLAKKIVVLNEKSPLINTFNQWNLTQYNRHNFLDKDESQEYKLIENRRIILEKVTIEANKEFFDSIQQLSLKPR
jgi:dTDP-N-acetylfucosamine:lipid II N-acetylfucosaminyltransferase